jgi:spermidine/putrescine ABC transporter ATP-binding subunit
MVRLYGISKSFGKVIAVDNVDLEVNKGEMLSLLGPSGCGKTTLLRILSGFEQPDKGELWMNGVNVTALPPEKRPTSLVFQNYALFPHMTVFENIAYGLRVKKMPLPQINTLVDQALAMVGLSGLGERSIRQLSGGQQQRVTLARSLVMKPAVLLLDEPLSNLDAKLRVETRIQIRELQKSLGITSIFVTHDQEEALTISDRIAVMSHGKIVQIGTPEEIYDQPNSEFVADFIGKSNFLDGEYQVNDNGVARFVLAESEITILTSSHGNTSRRARLILRPEQMRISSQFTDDDGVNSIPATVDHVTFLGEMVYYHARLDNGAKMLIPVYYDTSRRYREGDPIFINWEVESGRILDN